jgi:molecular chaperone Hsp33
MALKETDTLRRFIFENVPVRGMLVHLDATWKTMLERQDYPEPVRKQLGHFLAAAALLSASIKYKGTVTIQIQGNGPIYMMVIEATSERSLRGLAKWNEPVAAGSLAELFGDGRLVITIDSELAKERYQSIVALEGDTIAQTIERYMHQSEQLETVLVLYTDNKQSTGMLLQKLPTSEDDDGDDWNRLSTIAATLSQRELNDLSSEAILHRLFHEDDVRLLDGEPVFFRCRCSRDRVRNMLRSLGPDEIHGIVAEQGKVSVTCEYCGLLYEFDAVDAEQIFASEIPKSASETKH